MSNKNTQKPLKQKEQPLEELAQGSSEEKVKPTKEKFGNLDKEKKYDISGLNVPKGYYLVRHFTYLTASDGTTQVEDPTSNRFQVYDPQTFNNLNKQPVKDGKQVGSQFNVLGLNVEVLIDPTK